MLQSQEGSQLDHLREMLEGPKTTGNAPPRARKEPDPARVATAPVQRAISPATQPQEAEAQMEGFNAGEMVGNLPSSFIKNAKAVLWDLPKEALGALKRYALDPAQYVKDAALVPRYFGDIKDAIKDDYGDYYGNLGRRVSEDPFRLLSDVAGVAAIGGGTVAGVGTKLAGVTRLTSPAVARSAIAVSKGARAVKKLTYLDPVDATFGAVGKITPQVTDALGIGRYTPDIRALEATIDSANEKVAQDLGRKLWFEKLTPADREMLTESFVDGDIEFLNTLKTTRPDLWKARQTMLDEFLDGDSRYWTEEEKVVKGPEAHDALVKGLVRWRVQKGTWVDTPEARLMDQANELIKSGRNQPVYVKIFNDSGRGDDLFDVINDKIYNSGVLSRAERRMKTGAIPTDINQILAHQIRASLGAKKSIQFARAVQELMSQKGELKFVRNTQGAEKLKALGYAPFKGPFWEKYFDTFGKAVNHIADKFKASGGSIKNAVDAAEEFKSMALKAEEMLNNPVKEVWVPRHVAAYVNQKLNPDWANGFLGRATRATLNLGGMLPYYKAIATVFNPRYYIANAVGNAALAFLYGLHPSALKYAHTLKDFVPDEIADIGLSPLFRHEAGAFMGTANRFAQFAQKIDLFFKRAVYMNDVVIDGVKKGILKTGRDFFVAEDALKAHLIRIRQAPNEWVNNLTELTKAKERIAPLVMKYVNEQKKLNENINTLTKYEGKQRRIKKDVQVEQYTRETGADWVGSRYSDKFPDAPVPAGPGGFKDSWNTAKPGKSQEEIAESDFRFARDTGKLKSGADVLSARQEKSARLKQDVRDVQTEINVAEAAALWDIVAANKLQGLSPALYRESQMADRAIDTANKFFGSYTRLSPFERKIMRQFIPFYTFTKAMTQLAFRLPFRMPARQFMYLNLYRLWEDTVEDSPRSSWFKNLTPVMALSDGSVLMIRDGSFNPFANVRMSGTSGLEVPGAFDILGSHPLFRLIINGRGQLTAKPVSPGEKGTRLDNGEVWEFTGSGFKRVVAQPSWKKALWSLFPQALMIDSLMLNAVQSDKGFTAAPDPILGPDGKPVFPLGWQERVIGTVIPATRVNLEQLKRRELGKYNQLVRSYLEDMRRAPPAKREAIRQVLMQLRQDIGKKYFEY